MSATTDKFHVPHSALSGFFRRQGFTQKASFSSVEMALDLNLTADDCRLAIQKFVDGGLLCFAGFDALGIETWQVSRDGARVWDMGRVNCRVTRAKVTEFLQRLPFIVNALSRVPEVDRVLVGGAWAVGNTHGPFLIGIEVQRGLLSHLDEMRLIEIVLQFTCDEQNLGSDSTTVIVYSKGDAGVPQRMHRARTVWLRAGGPQVGIESSPSEVQGEADTTEASWGARLRLYGEICRFEYDKHLLRYHISNAMSSFLADMSRVNGRGRPSPPKGTPFTELPLTKQMVALEIALTDHPAECRNSPVNWVGGRKTKVVKNQAREIASDLFDPASERRSFLFLPRGWTEAVAHSDYWRSRGEPMNFPADDYREKLAEDRYAHAFAFMELLHSHPRQALDALSIAFNEHRAHSRDKKITTTTPARKPPDLYYALFDISQRRPTCYALVRQPPATRANLEAAFDHYELHLLRNSSAARSLREGQYRAAVVLTAMRRATVHEVDLFNRVAKRMKRAVSFISEQAGETIVGFRGSGTTLFSEFLNLKDLPEDNPVPIEVAQSEFEQLLNITADLDSPIRERLRAWWICPEATSAVELAQGCFKGPNASRLARLVDPNSHWTFEQMIADEQSFAATISGDDWSVRLENIGADTPPLVVYRFRGAEGQARLLLCEYPWCERWTDSMKDIAPLLRAFVWLEEYGVAKVLAEYDCPELRTATADLARFETLLNGLITDRLAHFVPIGRMFCGRFEPSFGAQPAVGRLAG